jgi:ubiquinone/menaquinone biosynthesis C-methylase UbiE
MVDMPKTIPVELRMNLEAYHTASAVAAYSNYYLLDEEAYLFTKYYRAGESVLDLACGMGRTTLLLHEMGMRVKGVDQSDLFIRTAKRRLPYLDLCVGSYDHIREKNASFSHVLISFNGIDLAFPETQRLAALQECVRVLKPGGTFIFSSHNLKSLHLFSPCSMLHPIWKLRHAPKAFGRRRYVVEEGMHMFYASQRFVIEQAELCGLNFLEATTLYKIRNFSLGLYFSPYIHYAFRKP